MAFEKVKKLNSDLKEKYPRLHKSARLNPFGMALPLPTIATVMGVKKALESDKAQSIKAKLKSKFRKMKLLS